jgi:hypothetical protein
MTSLGKAVEVLGFAIVPNVVHPDEIRNLLQDFSGTSFERSRAGMRHAMKVPGVMRLALDPRLQGTAQEVLGGEAVPFRGTLFDKSGKANWLVAWHQDTALPLREKKEIPGWGPWSVKDGVTYAHAPAETLMRVIALRVHLDDSTPSNGPLRVLPGTHRVGVLSDEEIRSLACKVPPVDCLVPRGGVLVMRPLLIHASSKSRSEKPRRVLHIEYASSMTIAEEIELAVA